MGCGKYNLDIICSTMYNTAYNSMGDFMDWGNNYKRDHTPIYYRIATDIKNKIGNGTWRTAMRIPGENELCDSYGASRITIRNALKKLETEGLIHRVNGKGTFVADVKQRTRRLILVLDRPLSEAMHLSELVLGALLQAQEQGCSVLVTVSARLRLCLDEIISTPMYQAGVILLRCREFCDTDIDYAEKHGIPCLLEGCEKQKKRNWQAVDNATAMHQIIDHLYAFGRRCFGLYNLATEQDWSSFKERYDAARARLAELGIPNHKIFTVTLPRGSDIERDAYRFTEKFFKSQRNAPDAIVCVNDMIAIQTMKWLTNNGMEVPRQIAVTGFDDIMAAAYTSPSLTTVRQNYYETGREAMNLLLSIMDDFDNKRIQILRQLPLVVRDSTSAK